MSRKAITDSDVASFQSKVLAEMQLSPDLYHPNDVEMMRNDSEICRRYLRHKRGDPEAALDMAKKSLQWRKEFGVNELTENDLYRLYFNVGCFIPFKEDKDSGQCIIFRLKLHRKNAERAEDMKRYMIFWVEKFLYQQRRSRITFIFDCTEASYSCTDLDQVMFMIQIFNELYPWALGHVIVYNMPWILKTVWLGIRALIPADGAERFKFCTDDEVFRYVDRENLPVFMGGSVPTPFRELSFEEIEAIPVDPNIEKRIGTTPAIVEFYRKNFGVFADSVSGNDPEDPLEIFNCDPDSSLSFESENGTRVAILNVKNCLADGRWLAFKVRTNRPDDFDANPHYGIIQSGGTIKISVTKSNQSVQSRGGKLLVQVLPTNNPQSEVMQIFKGANGARVHEKVILCEPALEEEDYEPDLASSRSPLRNASSVERWMRNLESYNRSSFNLNIVVCVLLVLNLAVALHGTVCRTENHWRFC